MEAMDLSQRLASLGSLAGAIRARREELIAGIIQTSKKTAAVAAGEVDLALARLAAFGEVAARLDGRAPVGTVAVVFPGNASISNPVSTIGTAFLAGNEVVGRFPGASRAWADQLEPLFLEHLPGVRFDHGAGPAFVAGVLADPAVAVIMIFGDDTWADSYEESVRESRTKFILEGPGKDPFLVLPGADVEKAACDAVRGGYYNAGQACTSPERFYVHASLVKEFVERVVELTRSQVVGEPERQDVTIGPIVSRRIAARIAEQLADAQARGAHLVTGGRIKEARLADGTPVSYVEPTVLTGVSSLMTVTQDETFGPVIPVQEVRSAAEALRHAADHRYGLAASLYGGTDADAAALAESHGQVFRDEIWMDYFRRNLHAPYGGRKRSGWVWAWEDGRFIRREGVRTNALEFSRAAV